MVPQELAFIFSVQSDVLKLSANSWSEMSPQVQSTQIVAHYK